MDEHESVNIFSYNSPPQILEHLEPSFYNTLALNHGNQPPPRITTENMTILMERRGNQSLTIFTSQTLQPYPMVLDRQQNSAFTHVL